ncbi:MAG: 2-dehydropantoate 2-reductase [Syntrophobacteraceae bacterium]|jgi:2-dehydropantoate 2-reductase
MKIAIMGTGGVGGYYGGLLAKAGHDVSFIARGAHLGAIREKGLEVRSVFGDFRIQPAAVTDDPASVGPVELIVFATKTYHIAEAARAILPMVDSDTVVLPLQNGIDAAERVGEVIGAKHVLGGVTYLSATIEKPGVIGQYSQFRRIVVGELNGEITERAKWVCQVLKGTGATVEAVGNIVQMLWTKFVFISAISAIGGLTRVTTGEYRNVPETRKALTNALREAAAIAFARGVLLEPDLVEKTLEFIDGAPTDMKPSMQRDIEAGRRYELESMIGIIVRLGKELNVPVPVMTLAYAVLKPGELKAASL